MRAIAEGPPSRARRPEDEGDLAVGVVIGVLCGVPGLLAAIGAKPNTRRGIIAGIAAQIAIGLVGWVLLHIGAGPY